MWIEQCHKPSPRHHHFYRWYVYHSQMGGLWHCFTHIINGHFRKRTNWRYLPYVLAYFYGNISENMAWNMVLTYLHRILKFPRPGGWSQTPSWWLRERRFPGCAQQLRHWDERMAWNGGCWMGNEWDMTTLMFHFRVVGLFFGLFFWFQLDPF